MKKTLLILSILLTLLVFSMSFVSGTESGELSSGVTEFLHGILTSIFPNIEININTMHVVIRKSAHVTEYIILGIAWFETFKAYELSFSWVLVTGMVIAASDETIQIFAIDRGPSFIDALLFDFAPFAFIGTILFFINNRKGDHIMTSDTLVRLQSNLISPESAYEELYKPEKRARLPFFKRAHFIKLKINVPGEKGVNTFLKILFLLPIPILLLRIFMGFVKNDRFDEDIPISKRELIRMISYKGVKVHVDTHSGEKILIKTI